MRLFHKITVVSLVLMAISVTSAADPRGQVKSDPQIVSKLAQILEKSGYTYRKAADNVWVVSFKGKTKADIQVFVTSAENLVIMGTLAAYGAYHANCTPGYLNNEGITPENLVAAARSGVFMGSALDWAKYLQDWRADGAMAGLQLTRSEVS